MPPKKKPAAAHGYKMPEPLPKNTILEDISKKRWRLGPCIGKGGFGEIYSAGEEISAQKDYCYALKIEPHSNGPLFVEINFYIRFAKSASIDAFQQKRGLETLGLPKYRGSGSHIYKAKRYRFLVIDKFGSDLCTLFKENSEIFPTDTVFKIGIQLVDVLEYIHECGYVHADIKPANIMMGATKETENKQVYLADFGLACRYSSTKEFKPDPRKAHDGTIEYLSRDAHQGVPTRRGDLEILAYNLIQWLGCRLPWENHLDNQVVVQTLKEEHMASASKLIKACFGTKKHPKAIMDYLLYLQTLEFDSHPDYNKIRKIFTSGVKEGNGSIGTSLKFSVGQTPSTKRGRVPLSINKSGNKKVKEPNENLEEPSGDEIPKPQTRKEQKAATQKEEKKAADDKQSSDEDDSTLMLKRQRMGRKKTANKVNMTASPKPERPVRKQKAEEVTEDKANVMSKPPKRGRKPAANENDKDETDLIPKPGKQGRKQTANKNDDDKNTNKDDEDGNTDLKPKRGRKLTANKDGEDDLTLKPTKRGRKQDVNEHDEDKNANKDNTDFTDLMPKLEKRRRKQTVTDDEEENDFMPKPGKRGMKIGGTEGKGGDTIDLTPKRLTSKEIRNLEIDLEQKNDSPDAKPKATRKFKQRKSSSLSDLPSPSADPFHGYTPAMKEIKLKQMEKGKISQKKPVTKLEKASSSTDIHEDNMKGYTAEMREVALKKQTKDGVKNISKHAKFGS